MLRYDASANTVQYYDSNHVWQNFPSTEQINLDEKTVNYYALLNAFNSYFSSSYSSFQGKSLSLGDTQGSSAVIGGPSSPGYTSLPANIVLDIYTNAVLQSGSYNPSQSNYITIGGQATGYYIKNNLVYQTTVMNTPFGNYAVKFNPFTSPVGKVVNGKIELTALQPYQILSYEKNMYNLVNNAQVRQVTGTQTTILSQGSSTQNSFVGSYIINILNVPTFYPANNNKNAWWYSENYLVWHAKCIEFYPIASNST